MTTAAFNDEHNWNRFEERRGYSKSFLERVRAKRRQHAREERRRAKEPVVVTEATEPEIAPQPSPEPENRVVAFVPPVRAIITKVAEQHSLTYRDILGPARFKNIVEARMDAIVAVHLAKPDLSLCQLGRLFNRDHTTILWTLRKWGLR
jgi:hypothetical protein